MADIENRVYSTISALAKAQFPTLTTASWPDSTITDFPYALIIMTDSPDIKQTLTSTHENEATHVTFEVNVYSNATSGRKAEAKSIAQFIAAKFKFFGFTQTAGGQPLDLTDTNNQMIARYYSRFEAAIDAEGLIHTINSIS